MTKGFRDDPNLDLLEESKWRLSIDLDEEWSLEKTRLISIGFGGWVTIFVPPWPFEEWIDDNQLSTEEMPTRWQIFQWRKDKDGNETRRAKTSVAVTEVLDVVPGRFHDWVVDITKEALGALEGAVPELGSLGPDLDDGAAILVGISTLRTELAAGQDHSKDLRRQWERFYGDLFLYDFPFDTDLDWRLGNTSDGVEAVIVRSVSEPGDRSARAFIPPDELTAWRWTDPECPAAGGRYMTPSEVLAEVPPEFRGWIAVKTHEALQHARLALFELGSQTLSDAEDLARMARLARHAHSLTGFSRRAGISYPGASAIDDEDHVAEARSPDGRTILLFTRSWQHLLTGHPGMEDHLDTVIKTLEDPEHREPDPRIGRERFFRRGGPEMWVRVVVEMAGPIDRVVTAFPQTNPPEGWRRR